MILGTQVNKTTDHLVLGPATTSSLIVKAPDLPKSKFLRRQTHRDHTTPIVPLVPFESESAEVNEYFQNIKVFKALWEPTLIS